MTPAFFIVVGGYSVVVGIALTLSRNVEFSESINRDMHSFVP